MHSMTLFTRLGLLFALILSVMPDAGVTTAMAQRSMASDVYVSEMTDLEIEVGDSFAIDEAETSTYPDGESEFLYIEGDFSFLAVAFFDDSDDPEDTRDLFLFGFGTEMDAFENVDSDETDEYVWSLDVAETGGVEMAIYIEVVPDVEGNADLMVMLSAPTFIFDDEMLTAQDEIMVGGEPLFQAEPADIAAMLTGDSEQATPEETEDVSDSETDERGAPSTRRDGAVAGT